MIKKKIDDLSRNLEVVNKRLAALEGRGEIEKPSVPPRRALSAGEAVAKHKSLNSLSMKLVDGCPEGHTDHHGVSFLDPDGVVVDTLCPVYWWRLSAVRSLIEASYEGHLKSMPLASYLIAYKIK